jgi:hypothetical protein
MNAFELVNTLLEADDQMSASRKTGVYVFGPNLPDAGFNAPDVESVVDSFIRYKIVPPSANQQNVFDQLVKLGYTFFIKKDPGHVEVIGPIPAKTTPEGEERAAQYLGLENKDQVQYRQTPTSASKPMLVDYVLHGSKEMEQEAKEKRSVQTKGFGKLDPAEERIELPEHPVGYSGDEFQPLGAPAYLGIVYDQSSQQGIVLREIIPGGPAAQAGLRAGEVIVQGRYISKQGKPLGPFYVYTPDHLSKLLSRADIQYPIQLRVVRGHGDTEWVPVLATPNQQAQGSSDLHIPAKEVQASARKPRKRPSKPAAVQQSFAKKLFRPNEPTPARETGNLRPNVSSIT